MREYKAKKDNLRRFSVTKDDFEIARTINSKLEQNGSYYGLCPICNGPVKLIGLYKENKSQPPYGRHEFKSVEGVAERTEETDYCPYNSHRIELDPEAKYKTVTATSIQVYRMMRDYFDKIMYIAQEFYDIFLSKEEKKKVLAKAVKSEIWLYPGCTPYNLPWIIMYFYDPIVLSRKLIKKDSKLAIELKKEKYELAPYNARYANHDWVQIFPTDKVKDSFLKYRVATHRRYADSNDELTEYVEIWAYSQVNLEHDVPKKIYKHRVDVDQYWLYNLINSEKAMKKRDTELLEFSHKLMAKEPEITE